MGRNSISVRLRRTHRVGPRLAHDMRRSVPDYVDPARSGQNAVLVAPEPGLTTARLVAELDAAHRAATGRARRRDSRPLWECVVTFGRDADLGDRAALDEAVMQLADAIGARWGYPPPLWVVRHEDESRPHYHLAFANAHRDTARPIQMGPADMRAVQDLAGTIFGPLGIERGTPKRVRQQRGEPMHKWVYRSVRELHRDLPRENAALRRQIAQIQARMGPLRERQEAAERRLQVTLKKLEAAQGENAKLEKRAAAYRRRLEAAQAELSEAQAEIERLRAMLDADRPQPQTYTVIDRWERGPLLLQRPVTREVTAIDPADHDAALLTAERRHDAVAAGLRDRGNALLRAIEALHAQHPPPVATSYDVLDDPARARPRVIHCYDAVLLDYGPRLVSAGDGTALQQAAALYRESRRRWSSAEFWGLNEGQIEWVVRAAYEDGYQVDFAEDWAQRLAAEIRADLERPAPAPGVTVTPRGPAPGL